MIRITIHKHTSLYDSLVKRALDFNKILYKKVATVVLLHVKY